MTMTAPDGQKLIAVLHTDALEHRIGKRGGAHYYCKLCGWTLYTSDRNWVWKTFDHLATHGMTAVSTVKPAKPEPKPEPRLRRVK